VLVSATVVEPQVDLLKAPSTLTLIKAWSSAEAVGILLVVVTLLLAHSSLRQAVVVAATTTKQTQTSFISVVVLLRVVAQEMMPQHQYVHHQTLFRETMVVQALPTLAVVAAVKVR